MALGPCRECEKEVSSKAKVCPNCGVPRPFDDGKSATLVIVRGTAIHFSMSVRALIEGETGVTKERTLESAGDTAQLRLRPGHYELTYWAENSLGSSAPTTETFDVSKGQTIVASIDDRLLFS